MTHAVVGLAIILASVVRAAPSAAAGRSLDISPSAATAGRGGAGTAAFWSTDVDAWANPALLGYVQGLDYRWTTTRLVPDLPNDISFRTYRLALGGAGLGLDLASNTIDYGVIPLINSSGVYVGSYQPTESADPTGVGLSLSRLIDAVSALGGGSTPAFARYADLALGCTTKDLTIALAPPSFGGTGSAHARDFGLLVRVNPVPRTDAHHRFVEMAYGYADLNGNDEGYLTLGGYEPIVNQQRHGVGIRAGFPVRLVAPGGPAGWIVRGMDPYLTVSVAADHAHHEHPSYDADVVGLEVDLGGVVTGRLGHVSDRTGGIHAFSFGAGIGLPLARFLGLRYDFASYPEVTGLSSIHRHGIGVWFDPGALARR